MTSSSLWRPELKGKKYKEGEGVKKRRRRKWRNLKNLAKPPHVAIFPKGIYSNVIPIGR